MRRAAACATAPFARTRRRAAPGLEMVMVRTTPPNHLLATVFVGLYPNHGGQRSGIRNPFSRAELWRPAAWRCPLTFPEAVEFRRNPLSCNALPPAAVLNSGGHDSGTHNLLAREGLRMAATPAVSSRVLGGHGSGIR